MYTCRLYVYMCRQTERQTDRHRHTYCIYRQADRKTDRDIDAYVHTVHVHMYHDHISVPVFASLGLSLFVSLYRLVCRLCWHPYNINVLFVVRNSTIYLLCLFVDWVMSHPSLWYRMAQCDQTSSSRCHNSRPVHDLWYLLIRVDLKTNRNNSLNVWQQLVSRQPIAQILLSPTHTPVCGDLSPSTLYLRHSRIMDSSNPYTKVRSEIY